MSDSTDHSNFDSRRSRRWIWVTLVLVVVFGGFVLVHLHQPHKTEVLPVVARTDLLFQNGLWFRHSDTNVFTGWMVETYPDGSLCSRAAVTNGLLNGLSEGYYTNGQIQIREYYQDSVADGLREKWYENGQKKSEAMIIAGKLQGTFRSWHENGQLAEQIEMKQGNPDGEAWAFYGSGFVKAQTQVQDGRVLARKIWDDGEHRVASAMLGAPPEGKEN